MTEKPEADCGPLRPPGSLLPPRYVNVPVSLVYAQGNDPAVLTLIRIVGLCWEQNGRCTPALTAGSLARALQRGPRTLRRHLVDLEALGWLRVDRLGDRLILRPLPDCLPPVGRVEPPDGAGPEPGPDRALKQALAEAGIENPARDRLACQEDLEPLTVRAWHLWTRHPERAGLENPAGFIVCRLQAGHPPPDPYLQLVGLDEEQVAQLRVSRWTGDQDLDDELRALRPAFLALFAEPLAR